MHRTLRWEEEKLRAKPGIIAFGHELKLRAEAWKRADELAKAADLVIRERRKATKAQQLQEQMQHKKQEAIRKYIELVKANQSDKQQQGEGQLPPPRPPMLKPTQKEFVSVRMESRDHPGNRLHQRMAFLKNPNQKGPEVVKNHPSKSKTHIHGCSGVQKDASPTTRKNGFLDVKATVVSVIKTHGFLQCNHCNEARFCANDAASASSFTSSAATRLKSHLLRDHCPFCGKLLFHQDSLPTTDEVNYVDDYGVWNNLFQISHYTQKASLNKSCL